MGVALPRRRHAEAVSIEARSRAIYKKFGVHTRSQAVVAIYDEFEAISEKWYAAISKGIPKQWSAEWLDGPVENDPFRALYQAHQGEAEDEG